MARMLSALITILCLLTTSVTAVTAPAGKTHNIQKVFDTKFADSQEDGACILEYKDAIIRGYDEAIELLDRAIQALTWLIALEEEPSKEDCPEERDTFLRITQVFKPLFGFQDAWSDDRATGVVSKVKSVYEKYLSSHTANVDSQKPAYYLRCGDNWLGYLPPDSKDPREESEADANKYTISKPRQGLKSYPNGALYASSLPKDRALYSVTHPPEDPKNPICIGKSTRALSDKGTAFLLLCDYFYMVLPFALNKLSMAYHKPAIQEGAPFDHFIEKPLAVTWVHEMGHYVNDWRDLVPVNVPGTSGWETAVGLSEAVGAAVVDEAPDNYALFAAAMYYSDWHWATGKAKEKEEVVVGEEDTPV